MNNQENSIVPPYKSPYKLTDEQTSILDRIREELTHRHRVTVHITVSQYETLINPVAFGSQVEIEIRIGNWRTIQITSEHEMGDSRVFFYLARRVAEKAMMDLMRFGAERA